jgi:hypothetical protein
LEKNNALGLRNMQLSQTVSELQACNELTERFGLSLTDTQIREVAQKRIQALSDTGRVEFGRGIMKDLVFAFCDSPYITRDNYFDTLLSLIDSFYFSKNESEELIPDDELIAFMKQKFDTVCHGSLEYLEGTTLEELCRNTRYGYAAQDDLY